MSTNVQYDPSIIQKQANLLYRSANAAILFLTLLCAFAGGTMGGVLGDHGKSPSDRIEWGFVIIGLLIGGLIGYIIGSRVAFSMKLRAQLALCQVYIEYNTRK